MTPPTKPRAAKLSQGKAAQGERSQQEAVTVKLYRGMKPQIRRYYDRWWLIYINESGQLIERDWLFWDSAVDELDVLYRDGCVQKAVQP